jgi:hypothetical protein
VLGPYHVAMAEILTLAEYKAFIGSTNDRNDAKYTAALPAVNRAISLYSGRDFDAPTVTEERTFQYDGEFLDIDDAQEIQAVKAVVPYAADYVFTTDQWYAQPPRRDDSPVYYYLILPGFPGGGSPEMGFRQNLDVLAREGRWGALPQMVKVTATWGWPFIPADVKMAAKWTLDDWLARRPETAAPAESIESYSRGAVGAGNISEAVAWAIPMRARDLLAAYTKVMV